MLSSQESRESRNARRFPVQIPVKVRIPGSDAEVEYSTRDVSHRGVFVYTNDPLPKDSPIEFTMKLSSPDAPEEGVQVYCIGTVVRVEQPVGGDVGMAATIDSYKFLHSQKAHA